MTVISHETDPVVTHCHKTNDKTITFNNKSSTIKTLEHDTKGVIPALKQINTTKNITLAADKGYIMNDINKENLKKTFKTTLVTPYRKNQNKKNTPQEKQVLFWAEDIW